MFGDKGGGSMAEANVFGVAPSLENMRRHNSALGGKKVLFRGAFFWYHFRRYYFYMAPATVILGMILALTCWNTVEGHLVIGSLISMVSCIAVVTSYVMIVPWRKHPSTIVYNRAFTNIFFSFNIIVETINHQIHPDSGCEGYAVITQFLLLAGELWLTCIALDLVFSLTNPFTSYRGNMRTYHFIVWGLTSFISFVFMVDTPCQDRFEGGLCWVRIISPTDSCIWGFYLFWILVMYMYQFGAIAFAYMRLKKGLPITFEIRSKCAAATFRLLFAYGCYLFIMMMFFFVVASLPPDAPGTPTGNFGLVFLYTIAIRGFVDAWVWFMQHDFDRSVSDKANLQGSMATIAETLQPMGMHAPGGRVATDDGVDEESGISSRSSPSPSTAHRASLAEIAGNIAGAVKHAVENVAEASQETLDETDLSPQVNMALRKQIIKYVTMGVMKAASLQIASGLIVEDEGTKDNNVIVDAFNAVLRFGKRIADLFIAKDPILESMQVTEFKLENEHPFKAFAPDVFQKLRMLEGIDDQFYLNALQVTEKEQLSEGASGAFMFFCGGGEFIVKTIKKGEADVLHHSLGQYLEYLEANPKSLLSRFLGSYSLGVYAQTFYFVVMRNVFQPGIDINERYDIKGSWVNRSAAPVKPTKKVVCRHCNEMFIPVNKEKCSQIVGYHEANVVLKDNDLRTKISLTSKEALPVLQIIKKDSDLLAKLGVLDYR
jgi:1-phosphatidylinositol-4-phosphate 5-kinase